jgi:long-chain acyl-CoA synthetase
MKGYYQNPDVTAEVLEADGWFHTGNTGKIVKGGCIQIVDRKKQLFKLSQGEYVSPGKVEGFCAKSTLVRQNFVHRTSMEAFLIVMVVPSEEALIKYNGKEQAIQLEELKKEIVMDLDNVCCSEKLKGYEIPKIVILHGEEFTPESGFVMPTFKLKRPFFKKHFTKEIKELFASMK